MRQQIEGEERARLDAIGPEFTTHRQRGLNYGMNLRWTRAYEAEHGVLHRFDRVLVEQINGPLLATVKITARAEGYCGMWDAAAFGQDELPNNPPTDQLPRIVDHIETIRPMLGERFTVGVVRDARVHRDAPIQFTLECKALDSHDTWIRQKTRLVDSYEREHPRRPL